MDSVIVQVHRFHPEQEPGSYIQTYEVPVAEKTTVLDLLCQIQSTQDPSLSFRYSCRLGMCGSCTVTINGRERLACRTRVAELHSNVITIAPLHHLPLIKDLVVDPAPFVQKQQAVLPYFVPREERSDLVKISPQSRERQAIAPHLECIQCGACYSACTMVRWDREYLGPAALNRAFTLIKDSRDGAREARLDIVGGPHGCWRCHTQHNCMEVCPKHISPTAAIQALKRELVVEGIRRLFKEKPETASLSST